MIKYFYIHSYSNKPITDIKDSRGDVILSTNIIDGKDRSYLHEIRIEPVEPPTIIPPTMFVRIQTNIHVDNATNCSADYNVIRIQPSYLGNIDGPHSKFLLRKTNIIVSLPSDDHHWSEVINYNIEPTRKYFNGNREIFEWTYYPEDNQETDFITISYNVFEDVSEIILDESIKQSEKNSILLIKASERADILSIISLILGGISLFLGYLSIKIAKKK